MNVSLFDYNIFFTIFWIIFWGFFLLLGYSQKKKKEERAAAMVQEASIKNKYKLKGITVFIILAITFFYFMLGIKIASMGGFIKLDKFLAFLGFIIVLSGMILALWARFKLSYLKTSEVVFSLGDDFIKNGPYQWIRHPMYTGLLLILVGSTVIFVDWISFLFIFLVIFPLMYKKARREEKHHLKIEGYKEYQKKTAMFFPYY